MQIPCYRAVCAVLAAIAVGVALTGCSALQPDAHLAAFSTQMTGRNQVPPVATPASGQLFAVLNKNTRLFRWKLSFTGLSGSAASGHFHGPAVVGANANSALAFKAPVRSPLEGQATLTAVQAAELLAGKWYADIHTANHPGGEIRGKLFLRE